MSAKLLAVLTLLLLAFIPTGAAAKHSDRTPAPAPVAVVQNPAGSATGVVPAPATVTADGGIDALGIGPTPLPGRPPGDPPTTDPPPPVTPGHGRGKAIGRRCRGFSHRRASGERRSAFKRCVERLKQRAAKVKEEQAEADADEQADTEAESPEAPDDDQSEAPDETETSDSEG